MKIIPFVSSVLAPMMKSDAFLRSSDVEDLQERVHRLVAEVNTHNVVMFEEGGQIIQLDEGGCFIRFEQHSHWFYRPQLFEATEFEIHNTEWNSKLQQLFGKHGLESMQASGM